MLLFSKRNVDELETFRYNNSSIHDAEIKFLRYDVESSVLVLELFNPIFNVKYLFTFRSVSTVMNFKGSEHGSNHTVWYMTIEKDYASLAEYMARYQIAKDDVIYVCFGMFSGAEMHILAKEVCVETFTEPT